MTRYNSPKPQARPRVRRGVRIGPAATLHCALVATVAFLFVPWREVFTRWRTTVPYLLAVAACTVVLHWSGWPWVLAGPVSVITLVAAVIVSMAIEMRGRSSDLWRVRDGLDGAVILTRWNHRKGRHELHTWATFRHHRGLGQLVLDAAWADGPRPLWLNPATPSLRAFYLSKGAVPAPDGSRWLVLPEG